MHMPIISLARELLRLHMHGLNFTLKSCAGFLAFIYVLFMHGAYTLGYTQAVRTRGHSSFIFNLTIIYRIWPQATNRQNDIHMNMCNAVPLVWGSLELTRNISYHILLQFYSRVIGKQAFDGA